MVIRLWMFGVFGGRLGFIWLVNKILERERVEGNVGGLGRCGNHSEIKKWEKLR